MFPRYAVLDYLEKNFHSKFNPDEFYMLSVQHLLESTGSMFESLMQIGFKPSHIFLTGKIYSTHKETETKLKQSGINITESEAPARLGYYSDSLVSDIDKMWKQLSEVIKPNGKIIVLDDGGYALSNVPQTILEHYAVYGIEQTTSGVNKVEAKEKFPIIYLARSAAKTIIEPPIVSESVQIQLGNIIKELNPKQIGIVGYGHIGKAITRNLKENYRISVFDNRKELQKNELPEDVGYCTSLEEIYFLSDIIIGATGTDISKPDWIENSSGDKTLISVSSGDVEFNNLLRICPPYLTEKLTHPLQVLNLRTKQNHRLRILRGGMVANFTGSRHSGPGEIIQMTRGLLFAAVTQILKNHGQMNLAQNPITLDPEYQKTIVNLWIKDQPQRRKDYLPEILNAFNDLDWIIRQSI
ncbi:MAG: hypothetical protein LBH12_03295 [Dysgonamonadaceae bacterium]|jgi:S-adenosylhomocysteine hydrolase|nr:hypothetical protein [Dysgonamonadaceae bacterium]